MLLKITRSQWYLVHSDKRPKGWVFCVLLLPFKNATVARAYAKEHGLKDHAPLRGEQVKNLEPGTVEIVPAPPPPV